MPRRVRLPGADELFRATGGAALQPAARTGDPAADGPTAAVAAVDTVETVVAPPEDRLRALPDPPAVPLPDPPTAAEGASGRADAAPAVRAVAGGRPRRGAGGGSGDRRPAADERRSSGRERHEEKITVYVSATELIDLERARLTLRGEHGLAVDRGRIVREAIAVVLADLESQGEASILVRRLHSH